MAPTQGRTAPPDRERARRSSPQVRRPGSEAGRQGQEAQAQSGEPERPASHPIERRQSQTSSQGRQRPRAETEQAGHQEARRVEARPQAGWTEGGRWAAAPEAFRWSTRSRQGEPGWPGKPGRPAPPWSGPHLVVPVITSTSNSRLTNPVKPAACVISSNTPVVSPSVPSPAPPGSDMADDMQYRIDMPYISGRTGMARLSSRPPLANVSDHPDTVVGEASARRPHRSRTGKVMDDVEGEEQVDVGELRGRQRCPAGTTDCRCPLRRRERMRQRSRGSRDPSRSRGVRKRLRNRRGSDTGAAPDVDNGRPGLETFGHGLD